jgi:DNA (cytosine-5)-methyltransferase 3A
MRVLSLCDGVSGGQQAFDMLGIKFNGVENTYYASEIAEYSIKVTQKNYPTTIQLGDMTALTNDFFDSLGEIDILLSGTPCKSLSRTHIGNYNEGLDGSSKLFWDFVRIKDYIKPKYFLFENVESMKDSDRDIITEALGVEPIMINSSLFTAQDRKRYYWTNIPILPLPEESSSVLKDIMIHNPEEKLFYKQDFEFHGWDKKQIATLNLKCHDIGKRVYNPNMKCATLTAVTGGYQEKKVYDNGRCRKLTPLEYERLQGMKDNYTEGIANSKRYCACGDGWTIPVIAHILKGLKEYI